MKKLLLLLSLVAAFFAAAGTVAPAPSQAVVRSSTIGDGGGQGICGPYAGVAFTVTPTEYSIGLVPAYNASGQFVGYDYRWGTTRWYCTGVSGPVRNYVTGGFSYYTGWAWVALDIWDYRTSV